MISQPIKKFLKFNVLQLNEIRNGFNDFATDQELSEIQRFAIDWNSEWF